MSGIHSAKVALGIEMLGDCDTEEFDKGRGLKPRQNAVARVSRPADIAAPAEIAISLKFAQLRIFARRERKAGAAGNAVV